MDKFEVTHEMFAKAQLPNPSHWQDNPQKPVERVRWRDAKRYCNERSLLEGLKPCYNEKTADWDCDYSANGYRLPTEAEWEYACRAGTEGPYDFGRADKLRQYAWMAENSDQKTHPVGQKKPNGFGICDLYGNVSEWCEDVYSPTYYKESPAVDPHGPPNPGKDVKRVIRGGSWKSSPDQCRATARQGERTGDTDACFSTDFCGFRCVRRVTPEELQQLRSLEIVPAITLNHLRLDALPHLAVPGLPDGCAAGVFCLAEDQALAAVADPRLLLLLRLVESLLPAAGDVFHPAGLPPGRADGPLPARGREGGCDRAADAAAV